ncbi:MAG: hypothetical protein KDD46_07950 [Bdellovibrionales bacterium]|nr:hypothetical protein [Bdellovibrionales bacterium]
MNKITTLTLLFLIFLINTPKNTFAEWHWSEGYCRFNCNNTSQNECPEGTSQAPLSSPGVCQGFDLDVNSCTDAATASCGEGNFEIDWSSIPPLLNNYQVEEVQTPDGQTLTGKDAMDYLQKRFPAKTETQSTIKR